MKKLITLAAIIAAISSGCIKDSLVGPQQKAPTIDSLTDTINFDGVDIKLFLSKDSINNPTATDESIVSFNEKADYNYDPGIDARYFQGDGQLAFFFLSYDTDPFQETIMELPFTMLQSSTKSGAVVVPMGAQFKLKGTNRYFFYLSPIANLPQGGKIWIEDSAGSSSQKDSISLITPERPYVFTLSGNGPVQYLNRFKLLVN